MYHHKEQNCWFFGASADGRDYAADLARLRGGARRLRDGEVAVSVDSGACYYVMPHSVFTEVVGRASALSAMLALAGAPVRLEVTACHRNTAELPGGEAWEAFTFGNLTGDAAMLFAPAACETLGRLAGQRLSGVKLRLRAGESFPLLAVDAWTARA